MRTVLVVLWVVASVGVAACGGARAQTADVPAYRGSSARTGVMPGPGPAGEPRLAWQFQADAPIRSSPAVVGETVFVASTDGVVHALEFATGSERWRAELGADVGAASPLVVDAGVVVADKAGIVHALDPATGTERWHTATGGPIAGAAALAGGRVVVATENGLALALDPATGSIDWQVPLPGGVERSIAATDGLVYCALSGGLLVALRSSDGSLAWEARVATDGLGGTPTIASDVIFAAAGLGSEDRETRGVVALDAATGSERWRFPSMHGEDMHAPAVLDGRAYIAGKDATVTALDVATGRVAWTATISGPVDALPSIWATTLYVATTSGHLLALDTSSGSMLWEVPVVGASYSPVVTGGFVLVATNVGTVYAFGGPAT
jgi:eukaryotic-like serine/threonine-protein kinase